MIKNINIITIFFKRQADQYLLINFLMSKKELNLTKHQSYGILYTLKKYARVVE